MKKLFSILAILLCLCLLAACDAQELMSGIARLNDIAEQLAEDNDAVNTVVNAVQNYVEDASETDTAPAAAPAETTPAQTPLQSEDAYELPEEDAYQGAVETASAGNAQAPQAAGAPAAAESQPAPTQSPAEKGFTALTADQCVVDNDGLPHITLDCDGARSINEDVEGLFRYLVDSEYATLYYEYYKNAGQILSVLVVQLYDGDASYFTPFNLDLATGQRISGGELLSILGAEPTALADAELQLMGEEFEYEYGSYADNPLYEEQYARTISPDNADTERVWLGANGRLNFVAKIFSLAGAEYYEYPMDTGLRY